MGGMTNIQPARTPLPWFLLAVAVVIAVAVAVAVAVALAIAVAVAVAVAVAIAVAVAVAVAFAVASFCCHSERSEEPPHFAFAVAVALCPCFCHCRCYCPCRYCCPCRCRCFSLLSLPKPGTVISTEAAHAFVSSAVEKSVSLLRRWPDRAALLLLHVAFVLPIGPSPSTTEPLRQNSNATNFFFKFRPKIACQAPKPPKTNSINHIAVACLPPPTRYN
jgi:hypothetical protein